MRRILLHLLPAAGYALLGWHFWRTRWFGTLSQAPARMQAWERIAVAAALVLHGYTLILDLFPDGAMHFGFSYALSLMLWLAVLFYWVESFYSRMEGIQPLALTSAALGALAPVIFPGSHVVGNVQAAGFRLHFLVAMLAYSLFTIAAMHAMLMAVAERRLHQGAINRILGNLPPLLTMETLLFRIVAIAFVLLTLTVGSGIFFSEELFGKPLTFSHKTVFALASWLIFAALLVGRHFYGWRGRTALRWTLSGFVALLLAYVGTRFVVEVILGRTV